MLRISKLSDYAIIILGHMAKNPARTYAATDLAESSGVAATTVSKVLKALTRAAVLTSTRGVKGGYQLAKSPEKTTVASIIFALEGPIALTECGLDQDACQQSSSCHIRGNWTVINRALRTALESVTLADMAAPMIQLPDEIRIPLSSISVQPNARGDRAVPENDRHGRRASLPHPDPLPEVEGDNVSLARHPD